MPKNPKLNIARYKVGGGELNQFEFNQNQQALVEQHQHEADNLIPGTPPEAKADAEPSGELSEVAADVVAKPQPKSSKQAATKKKAATKKAAKSRARSTKKAATTKRSVSQKGREKKSSKKTKPAKRSSASKRGPAKKAAKRSTKKAAKKSGTKKK